MSLAVCDETLKCPTSVLRLMPEQSLIYEEGYNPFLNLVNDYDMVRLKKVRDAYYGGGSMSYNDIVDIFRTWRDTSEHIVLAFVQDYEMDLYGHDTFIEDGYLCIKASKRGNDVYKYLIEQKWKPISLIPPVSFFQDNWADKHTSMLSVTLSYQEARAPVDAAWQTFGEDFHLFITKLEQKYGPIEYARCWEATDNFYPHCHVVLAFKEHSFSLFERADKKGNRTWRVSDHDVKKIGSCWHSFSDIKGVQDTGKCLQHLTKYITKDLMSPKSDKTNAMLWFFRKQSYRITRDFFGVVHRSFAQKPPSEPKTGDLIKQILANCKSKLVVMGIFPTRDLKFDESEWYKVLKKPPPDVALMISTEYLRRCEFSR